MDKIPVDNSLSWSDDCLKIKSKDSVKRLVLLDGPNVIHGTKCIDDSSAEGEGDAATRENSKLSVAGFLSLIRYFIKNDFDVMAFVSEKYTLNTLIGHRLDDLIELGTVVVTHSNMLDDIMLLEMAESTDGVVLSNDIFRDHTEVDCRYHTIVNSNAKQIHYSRVNPSQRHKMTPEGHYVADHLFTLPAAAHFYCPSSNLRQELAEEYRELWSEQRKKDILESIDKAILSIRSVEVRSE